MTEALLQEAVDRTRRIETRLTRYLTSLGFDTGSRKPQWMGDGVVEAPSPAISLVDCLSAVPEDWDPDDEIVVTCRGQVLGCVLKP